jgi:hypothetical protein
VTAPVFTGLERRRRSRTRPRILLGVTLLIAFGIGLALGQALHDNPKPGGTQTSVRTLQVETVAPTTAP